MNYDDKRGGSIDIFVFMDEILWCEFSNEILFTVAFSHGAIHLVEWVSSVQPRLGFHSKKT